VFEPIISLGESLALGIGKVGVSDAPEAIHSTLSHNPGREQPEHAGGRALQEAIITFLGGI